MLVTWMVAAKAMAPEPRTYLKATSLIYRMAAMAIKTLVRVRRRARRKVTPVMAQLRRVTTTNLTRTIRRSAELQGQILNNVN